MRKFWLGIIGLAAASTANAAVVTFTLAVHDDGSGTATPTQADGTVPFAVYGDVSAADNAGLFGFGVDMAGNFDLILNMLPAAKYTKTLSQAKFAGFTAGVTQDTAAGKLSGLPDLGQGTNLIPVYGFGQTGGDLNATPPKPAGYTYNDVSANNAGPQYAKHLLLGIGLFHGATPTFEMSSPDNKASVYITNSGTGNTVATLAPPVTIDLIGGAADVFKITGTAEHTNLATGGAITVTGSNHLYVSEVDQLTADANQGSAPVVSIGDESGNLYTMAKISGDSAAVAAVLAEAFNNGAGDAQAARLHQLYDSQFGPGGFNFLNVTPNFGGAKVVNWDFATNTGATVDQLAVVPEPATMSLLGLGALGLLARRRRNA